MRDTRSLTESTAASPRDLLSTAERSAYRETGDYAECIRLYRELARRSPHARLTPIGKTGEGRDLYVFIAGDADKRNRPVVLLQNGIHAGENGGKDAAYMLLRDVLITKRYAAWLDKVVILSIPVFNADGHEHVSPYNRINENGPLRMGFRVTADRLNLNRDYIKADTPEMRSFLKLYREWLPDLLIDNHVTDGADYQWDLTVATHTEGDIAAPVGAWVKQTYIPSLFKGLEQDGHIPGWYTEGRRGDDLAVMTASPRYSTGYAAAQNRAALLVETHSLKPFRTRVWSHYDLMRVSLETVANHALALKRASQDADKLMAATKPGDRLLLAGTPGLDFDPYILKRLETERYKGIASGGEILRYTSKPVDTPTRIVRSLEPRVAPAAPAGYLIPNEWRRLVDLLELHGVRVERLAREMTGPFETYRFADVKFASQPFEGRFQVTGFTTISTAVPGPVAAGAWFVPMRQRAARLIMHILEPEAPDSALRWGFLHAIFEQKEYFSDYIFEPLAGEILAKEPALKAEFEAELKKDPAFAANPRARLLWLFRRSPYFESGKDLYPVLRVTGKTAAGR
jgi:hypothetical protein